MGFWSAAFTSALVGFAAASAAMANGATKIDVYTACALSGCAGFIIGVLFVIATKRVR